MARIKCSGGKTLLILTTWDNMLWENPDARVLELSFQCQSTSQKSTFVNLCKIRVSLFSNSDLVRTIASDTNFFIQKLGAHTSSSQIRERFSIGPLTGELQLHQSRLDRAFVSSYKSTKSLKTVFIEYWQWQKVCQIIDTAQLIYYDWCNESEASFLVQMVKFL